MSSARIFGGLVLVSVLTLVAGAGCAAADTSETPIGTYESTADPSDYNPVYDESGKADGVSPASFDRNTIVQEAFFTSADAVNGQALQKFFETSPYGTRSFLADETSGGVRAADVIASAARAVGINPIVLLARMQVEKGLVSKTARPSSSSLDYAFGCGCPDNRPCMSSYKGFDKQITCAADTLSGLHADSASGAGEWQAGKAKRTLDPLWVTPNNNATAALYGYTPWVLQGRGGNWLVWNVTRRYALHFHELGLLGDEAFEEKREPWIGTPCKIDADCSFAASGESGYCFTFLTSGEPYGFCSIRCEGYCPDRSGYARTFCVQTEDPSEGTCAAKSEEENDYCGDVPGTSAQTADRHIGSSGASSDTADACLPQL